MGKKMPEESLLISESEQLTRKEVLKRRIHLVKELKTIYNDHYWLLMEDMKNQFREYYWEYGISPFVDDEDSSNYNVSRDSAAGIDGNMNNGYYKGNIDCAAGVDGNMNNGHYPSGRCEVSKCNAKAMALTRFCHIHILFDPNQKLYKPCNYSVKSTTAGPILCGKPILASTSPPYCALHLQKAEKDVTTALRKAGLNGKMKFHVVVTEYVRRIQNKRRALLKAQMEKAEEKDDISI